MVVGTTRHAEAPYGHDGRTRGRSHGTDTYTHTLVYVCVCVCLLHQHMRIFVCLHNAGGDAGTNLYLVACTPSKLLLELYYIFSVKYPLSPTQLNILGCLEVGKRTGRTLHSNFSVSNLDS